MKDTGHSRVRSGRETCVFGVESVTEVEVEEIIVTNEDELFNVMSLGKQLSPDTRQMRAGPVLKRWEIAYSIERQGKTSKPHSVRSFPLLALTNAGPTRNCGRQNSARLIGFACAESQPI